MVNGEDRKQVKRQDIERRKAGSTGRSVGGGGAGASVAMTTREREREHCINRWTLCGGSNFLCKVNAVNQHVTDEN